MDPAVCAMSILPDVRLWDVFVYCRHDVHNLACFYCPRSPQVCFPLVPVGAVALIVWGHPKETAVFSRASTRLCFGAVALIVHQDSIGCSLLQESVWPCVKPSRV